jgi:tetratricopeptide (TPR) repeat protein
VSTTLDGLHLYEITMLVCGIALFLALLFAFVVYVVRDKPLKPLLAFFIVPILMIGFPTFAKISFDAATGKLEVLAREVTRDPSDAKARAALEETLDEVSGREPDDAKTNAKLAEGYGALGHTEKALRFAQIATERAPNSPEVRKAAADVAQKQLTDILPADSTSASAPPDAKDLQNIARAVDLLEDKSLALSPQTRAKLAEGQAAIGKDAEARKNLDRAIKEAPEIAISPRLLRIQPRLDTPR